MARRRKAKSRRAKKCKVVTVGGRRRRICWGAKGKIVSNTAARRKCKRKSTKRRSTKRRRSRR